LEVQRRAARDLPLPWDYADYSPFDLRGSVREAIGIVRPRAFVAIHREIWPGLLEGLAEAGIPRYLFAAYFPPASRRRARRYARWLSGFAAIGATEAGTEAFLRKVAPRARVELAGDPRIERVMARRRRETDLGGTERLRARPCLILASLRPRDFALLAQPVKEVLGRHPEWRLIAVPHDPVPSLVSEMAKRFGARRWSSWLEAPDESPLVVDRVGMLAELYRIAALVFVGGSFYRRVHNVLEPAAYGAPILTGPLIENSGEAMELAREGGLIRSASPRAFAEALERLMRDPVARAELSRKSLAYLEARAGAARRYADLLLE
jgi:3-deoxy-D-manno-octulosonic-acid transferase